MKLIYHEGKNFGDALNPLIFNYYLKEILDEDASKKIFLIGIGSILGLKKNFPAGSKKIVFSSGYAAGMEDTYGTPPCIDESYEIVCVRGPKTAKILNINENYAVADGAILIYDIIKSKNQKKKYKYTFIPHTGTEKKYQYKGILESLGIHYLSPTNNIEFVLEEIMSSEIIISEAMHGVIVADALRIPWIPIKLYPTINEFKWEDYCESLNLIYNPEHITGLYDDLSIKSILRNKFKIPIIYLPILLVYSIYRRFVLLPLFKKRMKEIINKKNFILSKEDVLIEKVTTLKRLLFNLKNKYKYENRN